MKISVLLSIAFACVAAMLSTAQAATQIAGPQRLAAFRAMLPPTNDPELLAIFNHPNTLWYDKHVMPRYFQHYIAGKPVMLRPTWKQIGPEGTPFNSNGNLEWPWGDPQVFDNSDGRVKNFVGLLLPAQRPVVVYRKSMTRWSGVKRNGQWHRFEPQDRFTGYAWIFPIGTNLVEVITNNVNNQDVAFKVFRMTRTPQGWLRSVYRPFPTRESYERASNTRVVDGQIKTIRNRHPFEAIKETAKEVRLRPISAEATIELLTKHPFQKCTTDSFIPTTDSSNQIVPRGYLGHFFGNATNQARCINCHRDANSPVGILEPGRDWYGVFRGSDEVLSFMPFDHSSVSEGGFYTPEIRLNRTLQAAGIVAWYDPAVHRHPNYGPKK